ncbi:MAG: response regulator transcription factor [Selenomonadaceae bacterium]|nr:response regulator transcription factor [Selenomonadaceae bacterium]
MIKILIADDQELIRESLKIVLDMNADMKVVGLAADGQKVLELLNKNRPDVILMDIRMPELDGVLCTKIVKEKFPDVKIIILTTFDDDEYVFYALKYGASGYLLKGCSVQELTAAIHTVMNGGSILNQGVITKVVKLFSQLAKTNIAMEVDGRNVEDLNRTERNIASLVGCGLSNKEIAEKLFLSEGTVRNALSSALSKLHLRDRTQLAIWAVQTGLPLMTTN